MIMAKMIDRLLIVITATTITQALRTLSHIEEATFFKKGQLQDGLKQLNLEQNPC